jgi:ferredoxin--NADP+ reductase
MSYVVTQPCCLDGACLHVCPVDCIHPGLGAPETEAHGLVYIDPAACIDCGACADVCPVDAIVPADALTGGSQAFAQLNEIMARDLAARGLSIGGTASTGTPKRDRSSWPLTVAIVGSGAAGCYAVEELVSTFGRDLSVTLFEKETMPGGLVRYGVAPDHRKTRAILRKFEAEVVRPEVTPVFNVDVGVDIAVEELQSRFDVVIWAAGATEPRPLNVPGADLDGGTAAIDLVRWYTGNPRYTHAPTVLRARRVVIVGNGNVALDAARMLMLPAASLAAADMPGRVRAALGASAVREVIVLGRRGVSDGAHSPSELLALGETAGFGIYTENDEERDRAGSGSVKRLAVRAVQRRTDDRRALTLRYFSETVAILGQDAVRGVRVRDPRNGQQAVIDCDAVVTAAGMRSGAQPASWGREDGHVLHRRGRVIDVAGQPVRGVYVVGWAKRGASGGIGTNGPCAQETVAQIAADLSAGEISTGRARPPGDIVDFLKRRGAEVLGLDEWKAISRAERRAHQHAGPGPAAKACEL